MNDIMQGPPEMKVSDIVELPVGQESPKQVVNNEESKEPDFKTLINTIEISVDDGFMSDSNKPLSQEKNVVDNV